MIAVRRGAEPVHGKAVCHVAVSKSSAPPALHVARTLLGRAANGSSPSSCPPPEKLSAMVCSGASGSRWLRGQTALFGQRVRRTVEALGWLVAYVGPPSASQSKK